MKLNKFTWNNGTQDSPIVLTNDQIKKLIAIGQRTDIISDIRGYITTNNRKINKFTKYQLTQQFPNLNIIYNEELADVFTIESSTDTIEEGTRTSINILSNIGITHDFLKWKYEYSDFVIDDYISQDDIKDRIHIEDGFLVVDDPQENSEWSVTLNLTAYPIYYSESEFDDIPATSKPSITINIVAKKITDITASTKPNVPINSKINITVTPVPSDSTKLKGATYTYTTTTPEIVDINTSTLGTEIIAKKEGTGNITITLHACNNTISKSNTVSFSAYNASPMCFIIDQRYIDNLKDPDAMVSANYIRNNDGSLYFISNSASVGSSVNNALTRIRENTHAYVSKDYGINGIRLKQLDDTTRKKFADGTSSVDYISDESGIYDVFIKFGSDIYYKTEPYTPPGETIPNYNYVLVTIADILPEGENANNWEKWSQYKLIGVYKSSIVNSKVHSLSNKRPMVNTPFSTHVTKTKSRGNNYSICDYDMTKLFTLLFYGYYSSLNSQEICGYGTSNYLSSYGKHYPKITGNTDNFCMTDTTKDNGTGPSSPNIEQVKAGIGDDIKSVNFWGLENCWGETNEYIYNVKHMYSGDSNIPDKPNITNYITHYISVYNAITISKLNNTDVIYDSIENFKTQYPNNGHKFIGIFDKNDLLIRAIDLNTTGSISGTIKKLYFGKHADTIAKEANSSLTELDLGFSDATDLSTIGTIMVRSGNSNTNRDGIACIYFTSTSGQAYNYSSRLMYNGDENTVHVIDDATETL